VTLKISNVFLYPVKKYDLLITEAELGQYILQTLKLKQILKIQREGLNPSNPPLGTLVLIC